MSRINTLLSVAFVSMISATSLTAFASSGFTHPITHIIPLMPNSHPEEQKSRNG